MEILKESNIRTNCAPQEKDSVIRTLGQMFVDDGYVEPEYIGSMLAKEKVFNTNIGNAVAIPHCEDDGRKWVKQSGLAIMTFPDGIDWGGEPAKIVIAIAGKEDEHMDILMKIALLLSDEEVVDKLVASDAHTIYETFTQSV